MYAQLYYIDTAPLSLQLIQQLTKHFQFWFILFGSHVFIHSSVPLPSFLTHSLASLKRLSCSWCVLEVSEQFF